MSSTPAASVEDIAKHGWSAVARDAKVFLQEKTDLSKPLPLLVGDIPFPSDDPIVAEVQAYAKQHLVEPAYNHSMRVYYFGYCIMHHQSPSRASELSLATWALACLLHDIGTTHDNLRATLLSFEWYGGILAMNLVKDLGAPAAQAEAVAEAIIRHQDVGTVGKITFLGQIIQLATLYDNLGGNPDIVDKATRDDVNRAFPRLAWSECFASTIREENGLKPWAHTTHLGEEDFPEGVKNNQLMKEYE